MHKKILLVEDSKLGSFLLRRFLTQKFSDIECVQAFTYAEAKAELDRFRPDLVFLDLNLPFGEISRLERMRIGRSDKPAGIRLLSYIKRCGREIRIIACSGAIPYGYEEIFTHMNVTLIPKPLGHEEIATAVMRLFT